MNVFNEEEYIRVCSRFDNIKYNNEVEINLLSDSFFYDMKRKVETERRGEVVFCVIRPNGKVITVTCEGYPKGTFRIPTGGIGYGEDIVEAVFREVREELGLDVEIIAFAGVIKICFKHENDSVMFYSYLFILKEAGGRLLLDASDDEVSGTREETFDELHKTAVSLKSMEGFWYDWGRFRYETTNTVSEYLKKHAGDMGINIKINPGECG